MFSGAFEEVMLSFISTMWTNDWRTITKNKDFKVLLLGWEEGRELCWISQARQKEHNVHGQQHPFTPFKVVPFGGSCTGVVPGDCGISEVPMAIGPFFALACKFL